MKTLSNFWEKPARSGVTRNGDAWWRRSSGRLVVAGIVRSLCRIVVIAPLIAVSGPVWSADDSGGCPPLTFRRTAGPAIRGDVVHPPPMARRHPPFLSDPEIVSVTPIESPLGDSVRVKLAPGAVDVLSAETAKHIGQQLLIMLGDKVVFTPMIRGRLGPDDMVVSGAQPDEILAQWRSIQQQQQRCHH